MWTKHTLFCATHKRTCILNRNAFTLRQIVFQRNHKSTVDEKRREGNVRSVGGVRMGVRVWVCAMGEKMWTRRRQQWWRRPPSAVTATTGRQRNKIQSTKMNTNWHYWKIHLLNWNCNKTTRRNHNNNTQTHTNTHPHIYTHLSYSSQAMRKSTGPDSNNSCGW